MKVNKILLIGLALNANPHACIVIIAPAYAPNAL